MSVSVPDQYKAFLLAHGPFEGFMSGGEQELYVALWPLDELPGNNSDIQIQEFAPGFLAFASDGGGGEVFAFDDSGAVFMLPLVGMEPRYAMRVAGSFAEFSAQFEFAA